MVHSEVDFTTLGCSPIDADIVIVPNFGGWGNVPLSQARDLEPIITGVQQYLDSCGWRTIVAPYRRAPAVFPQVPECRVQLGVITEMLGLHHTRARRFVNVLEAVARQNPKVKFLLIGLSNGATFVDKTVELMSSRFDRQVAAVAIGIPFWSSICMSDNIIHLDNGGGDPLTQGQVEELVGATVAGLFLQFTDLISGRKTRFEDVWQIPDHFYRWEEMRLAVVNFINHWLVHDEPAFHH